MPCWAVQKTVGLAYRGLPMSRLLHTGQVIIDLVMRIDALPGSGADALAKSASFHAGGGFNVMAAAQRNGLQTLYVGRHGQGQFGDIARLAMQDAGIEIIQPIDPHKDTGLCVALTEANAERTFISYIGAEGFCLLKTSQRSRSSTMTTCTSVVTACCSRARQSP